MVQSPNSRMAMKADSMFCFKSDFISSQRETLIYQFFLGSLFSHLQGLTFWETENVLGRRLGKEKTLGKNCLHIHGKTEIAKDCQEWNLQRKLYWKLKDMDWREGRIQLKGDKKGSHLHQVIASLAADNEIVLISIHRLQVSDDGKLIPWDRLWAPYSC